MGGGIGMGNTCKPMAISFQCMTKPTTIKNNNKNKIKLYVHTETYKLKSCRTIEINYMEKRRQKLMDGIRYSVNS